jgi:hypothetical protein
MTQELETKNIYDECFTVSQQRWGTWRSYDLEGKCIITSLTEDECINATRSYLKMKQEGFVEVIKTYESTVGGKL